MIGKRPNAAPSDAASSACPAGIRKAKTATPSATTRDAKPACHAFQAQPPEQHEQGDERQRRDQCGKGEGPPDGIGDLGEHGTPS